jgi:hypothetical protein
MAKDNLAISRTAESINEDFLAVVTPALEVLNGINPRDVVNHQAVLKAGHEVASAKAKALHEYRVLRDERLLRAEALYHDDPIDNAQRLADMTEAAQHAATFSTGIEAETKLTPRAWELLALGQWQRAAVLVRALELKGRVNTALSKAVQTAMDSELPNRIQANVLVGATQAAYLKSWAEVNIADALVSHYRGDGSAEAQARIAAKMQEAVQARQEGRSPRPDAEIGLTPLADHSFKSKNGQLDSRTRGVDERTTEGRAK